MSKLRQWWLELLFVVALFVAALGVRVYRLPEIPPGLWLDEAANGLDVMDVLQGQRPIFFERNNGREPFFFYLQALVASFAGVTPFALRLTAALVGTLTVVTTYWMLRTLFADSGRSARWIAGWSALFLAFSYWHLSLSRLGLRAITLPLLATLTFVFFWRAWRRLPSHFPWLDLLLCGGLAGLSLYTYTASRFIPVLIVATVAAGLFLARRLAIPRLRQIAALAVIGLAACIVFAPLGYYFLHHPASFLGRAAAVSVFSKPSTDENAWGTLAKSAWKTVLMFVSLSDPNFRHNPAGRPVFDPLLALWLGVGIVVAVAWLRDLRTLFLLFWLGLLALPALLTAEGLPHSLRGIGMLPAAITLPVVGMLWVGQRLGKRWPQIALWLPLPFLLFSSVTGVRDYFQAWQNPHKSSAAFLTDYVKVGQAMVQHTEPNSVWVVALSPNYVPAEGLWSPFYTIEFFVHNQAAYGSVIANPTRVAQDLATLTQGHRFAQMFRIRDATFFDKDSVFFDDSKNLVEFLLSKHGQLAFSSSGAEIGVPYKVYALVANPVYPITQNPRSVTVSFADQVKLTALDYGRTRLNLSEPVAALTVHEAPSGQQLWMVLDWQAQMPIARDLKTSLLLKDERGHIAGQVDDLLVGDRYPVFRTWNAGETSQSYHILPILPAVPPGDFALYLKVYENQSGRVYPAKDATGQQVGTEVRLGAVTITRPLTPTLVSGDHPLPDQPHLAPEIALLGFDLPRTQVAPGDQLPVTLYWQAEAAPTADYSVTLQLQNDTGAIIAQQQGRPGNNHYPTKQWHAHEVLRDWYDLPISTTTPTGLYSLRVLMQAGAQTLGEQRLGQVTVQGRPRLFTPPPIAQPFSAVFGQAVQLLGINGPAELVAQPGATLEIPLVWQVQATPTTTLVRFVHLLGTDGRPVAQQDTVPCNNECPATSWLSGEILTETATLTLPADLPSGVYRLVAGWYDPDSQQRLPALDAQGQRLGDDLVQLPVVTVR